MKVPEWENQRPVGPWLPVIRDRRYVDGLTAHRLGQPRVDADACNMCSLCWILCPDGAITRASDRLIIDYEDCRGCGICVSECPRHAIAMRQEGG